MCGSENNENKIAIIGMSCRFPGASNIEEFWSNLKQGRESISILNDEELIESGVLQNELENPNYIKVYAGIDGYDEFDAEFFGYSSMEAKMMDPQHRKILEETFHALEDAGYDYSRIEERVGVFTGVAFNNYIYKTQLCNKFEKEFLPILIANDKDFVSTKISYKMGFTGPSINVQNACCSAMVAIHLARQSLMSGEIDMAVIGTSAIRVPQKAGYYNRGTASQDGHIRTFDEEASGTIFGSGIGVLILKHLEDAEESNDHIYAVITGSAINNDGACKAGFTGPGVESQSEVIIESIANAGIVTDDISYVEAHGAGTVIGDMIEIKALTDAFGVFTKQKQFCDIGSVKPNIGHLDVSAGMSSIIKLALQLEHKKLVPSINCKNINKVIDIINTPFKINTEYKDWIPNGEKRIGGIFTTAIGGTNAFVILEEYTRKDEQMEKQSDEKLFVFSAKHKQNLKKNMEHIKEKMQYSELDLEQIAYTLQCGRHQFEKRYYFVCSSYKEAICCFDEMKEENYHDLSEKCKIAAIKMEYYTVENILEFYKIYKCFDVFVNEFEECMNILGSDRNNLSECDDVKRMNLNIAYFSAMYKLLKEYGVQTDVFLSNIELATNIKQYLGNKLLDMKNIRTVLDCIDINLSKREIEVENYIVLDFGEGYEKHKNHFFIGNGKRSLMNGIGMLWVHGYDVDWFAFNKDRRVSKISIPGYYFSRSRYNLL